MRRNEAKKRDKRRERRILNRFTDFFRSITGRRLSSRRYGEGLAGRSMRSFEEEKVDI